MEKIILDANFLLAIYELKLDIFEALEKLYTGPYKLYVLDKTIDEVEKLIKSSSLSRRQASRFAKKILANNDITRIETQGQNLVDNILVDLDGYTIATADRELKRRLKQKGKKVITIRQKKYLIFA